MSVSFWVAGTPIPQGSMSAFVNPATGHAVVTHQHRPQLMDWRQAIAQAAREHIGELLVGPVRIDLRFALVRPQTRPKRDRYPDRAPDVDKLARSALDALTGVAFANDAQVCELNVRKGYAAAGEQAGVHVAIAALVQALVGL